MAKRYSRIRFVEGSDLIVDSSPTSVRSALVKATGGVLAELRAHNPEYGTARAVLVNPASVAFIVETTETS